MVDDRQLKFSFNFQHWLADAASGGSNMLYNTLHLPALGLAELDLDCQDHSVQLWTGQEHDSKLQRGQPEEHLCSNPLLLLNSALLPTLNSRKY